MFAREVWYRVLAPIDLDHLAPQPRTSFLDWWLQSRHQLGDDASQGFRLSHNPWSVVSLEGASWLLSLLRRKQIAGLRRGTATSPCYGRPQIAVDPRLPESSQNFLLCNISLVAPLLVAWLTLSGHRVPLAS